MSSEHSAELVTLICFLFFIYFPRVLLPRSLQGMARHVKKHEGILWKVKSGI